MEDFANILHRDYGLKPQGKSAPMSASKPSAPPLPVSAPPIHRSSSSSSVLPKNGSTRSSSAAILGEDDLFFGGSASLKSSSGRSTYGSGGADLLGGSSVAYDDVFGGPPKFVPPSYPAQPQSSQTFEDIFRMPLKASASANKGSSLPVFDAPVYDDDIFGGVPGIRSADVAYDDVFSGGPTAGPTPAVFDDFLGGFGTSGSKERTTDTAVDSAKPSAGESVFDELLPGFGGTEPAKPRSTADAKPPQRKSSWTVDDSTATTANDPFVVLESNRADSSPPAAPVPDLDPFRTSARPPGGSGKNNFGNGSMEGITGFESSPSPGSAAPVATNKSVNTLRDSGRRKDTASPTSSPTRINASRESADGNSLRKNHAHNNHVKDQMRTSSNNRKPEPDVSASSAEAASTESPSRRSRQVPREASESPHHYRQEDPKQLPKVVKSKPVDEFWITIDDVKLVTQPTAAPPPSRPPPAPTSKQGYARKRVDRKIEGNQNFNDISAESAASKTNQNNSASVFDELEEFAAGGSKVRKDMKGDGAVATSEDDQMEVSAAATASALAMKEAMERAEAKLRLAKEAKDREREERAARVREERREARERGEEKAREQEEDREAKSIHESDEKEREEKEREARERRRKEKEKEREREREREREKDRIAVERATQEARERAAAEAKERAEKTAAENREKAQRAAVERATAEARERAAADARDRAERTAAERERAERAAVERATAEARERAGAEARERAAERAAVERASSEARARAERAAVERANAEARERLAEKAAAEAREREEKAAAERSAATREQQRRNENDLESFFMSNSRPTSVPRQRSPATARNGQDASDLRQSSKGFSSEGQRRSSNVAATPSAGKGPSVTSMGDDWTSLFGAPSASGEFQEVEGESEERRRARWERHVRTRERAAKALDEKNQRDLKGQMEQAERHRVGEIVDAEIKRWAAGKEGNLRALLSTLQYVLWPECGWQTVSLTDLITAASVKKVYRKATLCVHPDKVQQKGATIQQKYIAEKVFDLLKEAWNKFNSEELF